MIEGAGLTATVEELISLKKLAKKIILQPKTGDSSHMLRKRGMIFSEIRHYQAGDEIKHMAWRVTARSGKPHVKILEEERENSIFIVSSFDDSMFFGTKIAFKSVVAARIAALWAWVASNNRDKVGAIIASFDKHYELTPKSRQHGVLQLLRALSRATQIHPHKDKNINLCKVLERVEHVAKPGSLLIVISDFYNMNTNIKMYIKNLQKHHNIIMYHICDPIEIHAPKPGLYGISDGKKSCTLNLMNKRNVLQYNDFCKERILNLKDFTRNLGIPYVIATGSHDLTDLVFNLKGYDYAK